MISDCGRRGDPRLAPGRTDGVGEATEVVVVVAPRTGGDCATFPRWSAWPGLEPDGVGSNVRQPSPANQTSAQACALRPRTTYWFVAGSRSPGVNPTTTRAGNPAARASAAKAAANC